MTITETTLTFCLTAILLAGCGLGLDNQARLERGEQAYQAGEYRVAIIDAKYVLQQEPKNVTARLLLGRAAVEVGDGVSAEVELRRALELGTEFAEVSIDLGRALLIQRKHGDVIAEIDPALLAEKSDRLFAIRMRGDSYIGLGQPGAARDAYYAVLREDEENKGALLGVVQSHVDENNLLQARQTLDQILGTDSNHVPAWIMSGSLNSRTRNFARAGRDFATAVGLANESSQHLQELEALFGLADSHLKQGRIGEVVTTLARMKEIAAEDTRTFVVAARLAAAEGNWASAQRNLHEVLKLAPDHRPAQMLLGMVHKTSGNLEQAEMYLSAVVAGMSNNADARRLLAETRLQLNKTDEARQALEPLMASNNVDPRSLAVAAAISLQTGEFDHATELLERGILANPGDAGLQLQLAFAHFQAGRNDEARRALQEISAATSENTEFQRDSLLVLTQVAQGQIKDGGRNAAEIASRWPDRAAAHNLLGFVQAMDRDYDGARQSFVSATRLAPESTAPLWFLAQVDEIEDDPVSAGRHYKAMLDLQPEETRALVALARLSARRNDHTEAIDWLRKANASDKLAVTPRKALGSILLASKDFAAAKRIVEDALNIDERDAELHNILGLAELNQNNYRNAEASFDRAVSLDQQNPAHRLNLARAQLAGGFDRAAMLTLQEAVETSPAHIPTGVMLATLKANSGAAGEAKKIASRLTELHPDAAVPRALVAELLAREGDLLEASASYDEVLKIESAASYAVRAFQIRRQAQVPDQFEPLVTYLQERPLDNAVRTYLGQAYQSEGRINDAIVQYQNVLDSAPGDFIAANNLAWNYFVQGDSRAEELARRAYEIQPENSSVLDTLGWILAAKGEYGDAVPLLRDAVDLGNGRAEVRFHLAAALADAGEHQEAKEILQEVLSSESAFGSRKDAEDLLSTL